MGTYLASKIGFLPPPLAPVIQASETVTSGQVTLSWLWQPSQLSYLIERSVDGGSFSQIAEVDVTSVQDGAMSYTDTTVPSGNVVSYRIRAVSYAGTSAYSNIASAFASAFLIDPTDGLSYEIDILLGLDPLADNSGFFPEYPTGYGPPPPPPPKPPPVVTLLTPSGATLN